MKPCPSCQFLLAGDATVCQFCKTPIVAEEPDLLTAVFTGAPAEARVAKGSSKGAAKNGAGRGVGRLTGRSTSPAASAALTAAEPGVRIGSADDDRPKRSLPTPSPALIKALLAVVLIGALVAGVVKIVPRLMGDEAGGDPFTRPWTTYTAPDGSFTALAPGVPTTDTVALPQPDGTTLTEVDYSFMTAEHSQVIVNVVPLRPGAAATPNLLPLAVAGLAERGIVVDGQTPSTFGAATALSFSGSWQRDELTYDVEGRTFVVGDTLFVVMGTEVTGGVRTPVGNYERFLESFAPGG